VIKGYLCSDKNKQKQGKTETWDTKYKGDGIKRMEEKERREGEGMKRKGRYVCAVITRA